MTPLDINMELTGCAAKLRASELAKLLDIQNLGALFADTGKLSDYPYLHLSIDTLLPFTTDLELFGRISIFHSLGDLIAVGASPKGVCLSLGLGFSLTMDEQKILQESIRKNLQSVGIEIINAHTYICETSPVTICALGETRHTQPEILPDEIYSIILNKPIGGALLLNAGNILSNEQWIQAGVKLMNVSPVPMVDLISEFAVQGSTDISGFGLLGHLAMMANYINIAIDIKADDVPYNPYTIEAIEELGTVCSSSRNKIDFENYCNWDKADTDNWHKILFYASETSGPILSVVPESRAEIFISTARKLGYSDTCKIGTLQKASIPTVFIK